MLPTFEEFEKKQASITVVGLGYVGLPLAYYLAKKFSVIGCDINELRVKQLISGVDSTGELNRDELASSTISFTSDPSSIKNSRLIIATVPTPITDDKKPDLSLVEAASKTIGKHLSKGSVVVYESTVYPGVTEDICVPILEAASNLKCGTDFKVGYSPERINPSDKEHTLPKIVKVVSGMDAETGELLRQVYGAIITAGIHMAPNIKTAEGAKVIENIQRDLNIALMNELAIIFDKLGMNTHEVLAAAGTKWNFIPFKPGLVGGHCIGVDPYYLTHRAQEVGYSPDVILAGRKINDGMGQFLANKFADMLKTSGKEIAGASVLILGMTFKENIGDTRNTRVVDIYHSLEEMGMKPQVYDPHASAEEVKHEYGLELLQKMDGKKPYNGIIVAVQHKEFEGLNGEELKNLCSDNPAMVDVKGFFDKSEMESAGFSYYCL